MHYNEMKELASKSNLWSHMLKSVKESDIIEKLNKIKDLTSDTKFSIRKPAWTGDSHRVSYDDKPIGNIDIDNSIHISLFGSWKETITDTNNNELIKLYQDIIQITLERNLEIIQIQKKTELLNKELRKVIDDYLPNWYMDTFIPQAFTTEGYTPKSDSPQVYHYNRRYTNEDFKTINFSNTSKSGLSFELTYYDNEGQVVLSFEKYSFKTFYKNNYYMILKELRHELEIDF